MQPQHISKRGLRCRCDGRGPAGDQFLPIWHQVGSRSSVVRKKAANRHASHPVNAMLNYAYAVLESQVRIQVVAQGYDPSIGYLHAYEPERPALVLDLMEPLRPIVDRKILEFVQSHTFHPADFTIRSDGVCRLNPEMAKHVTLLTIHCLKAGALCFTQPRTPIAVN
jgi:CRISPR-associated protein Cas1